MTAKRNGRAKPPLVFEPMAELAEINRMVENLNVLGDNIVRRLKLDPLAEVSQKTLNHSTSEGDGRGRSNTAV